MKTSWNDQRAMGVGMADAPESQDYGKVTDRKDTVMQSKEISSKPMEMTKGGASSEKGGATSSSRSYPKGKAPSLDASRFNPMNDGASTYGINGVGSGEN